MSILINQKAWQFLLVLSAAPISRFLFRSLEPSPRDLKESPTLPGIVEGDGTWRCYPDWFETPGWNLVKFWGEPLASRFWRADDFRMHFLLGQQTPPGGRPSIFGRFFLHLFHEWSMVHAAYGLTFKDDFPVLKGGIY